MKLKRTYYEDIYSILCTWILVDELKFKATFVFACS